MSSTCAPESRATIRNILERIGDKWTVVVICNLNGASLRYNELLRLSAPITPRMLSATLRALERDGMVTRTVHPQTPPRVEYALTERGLSLLVTVRDLALWAEREHEAIARSRAAYDAAKGSAVS
ncbi:winged helix-turn-helix transcriptional regulator [Streptomyces sp. NPDC049040]|uniref:winged helix-turn-helix transcriptional regulator n=1 Tax=Streptomyces sp. NPDC049040 TaxID=3365593 RepID=UPI00371ECA1E